MLSKIEEASTTQDCSKILDKPLSQTLEIQYVSRYPQNMLCLLATFNVIFKIFNN